MEKVLLTLSPAKGHGIPWFCRILRTRRRCRGPYGTVDCDCSSETFPAMLTEEPRQCGAPS